MNRGPTAESGLTTAGGRSLYSTLLRPILFSLSPDSAHDLGQWFLKRRSISRFVLGGGPDICGDERLAIELSGMRLAHPVAIAPGLNKNGESTEVLARIGFSLVYVGSVRRHPFMGNPRPWMVRYEAEDSLGNAMGLPSKGSEYVTKRLREGRGRIGRPVAVSVVGESPDEMAEVVDMVGRYSDMIEINPSCPTSGREMDFESDPAALQSILRRVRERFHGPVFLKARPRDLSVSSDRDGFLATLDECTRAGVGVTICNTLRIPESAVRVGSAGLSGRRLYPYSSRMVAEAFSYTGGRIPIVGTGGIWSGREAFEMIRMGANAVGILTLIIYHGPGVLGRLLEEILDFMRSEGYTSIGDLRGSRAEKVLG